MNRRAAISLMTRSQATGLAFQRSQPDRDPSWTSVVKFTKAWNRLEGWVFPPASVEQGSTRDEARTANVISRHTHAHEPGHE